MRVVKSRWLVGVAVLAVTLTACVGAEEDSDAEGGGQAGDEQEEDSSAAEEGVGQTEPFVVGMAGIPPIFLSAVAYVAEEQGFFDDLGVQVQLRPFATSPDIGRAVTTGEIAAGMVGTPVALAMRASGSSVVSVLGFEASSYLIGTADSSVTDCESLEGQTIAVDAAGAPKALALTTMLASCGLTDADVEAVGVGGTQSPDVMIAEQVDTAVMHPDELAMVQEERETEVLLRITDADPLMHFFVLITNESVIDDDQTRGELEAVVAGFLRAIEYINDPDNHEDVAEVAAEMSGRSPDVAFSALENYLAIEYWPVGTDGLSQDRIEHVLAQQVEAGNIDQGSEPDYDDLVDLSIYEAAAAMLNE